MGEASKTMKRLTPSNVDRLMPAMRCDSDCGECCGVTLVAQNEYQRVMDYADRHGIQPRAQGVDCPWLHDGRCAVYEARPTICRIYGHTPHCKCVRGYNVNVSPAIDTLLWDGIARQGQEHGVKFLHEAAYGIGELEGIVRSQIKREKAATVTIEGQPAGIRCSDKAYAAGRTLKLAGIGFTDVVFVDEKTGEHT